MNVGTDAITIRVIREGNRGRSSRVRVWHEASWGGGGLATNKEVR
jgi:hypothetical protein